MKDVTHLLSRNTDVVIFPEMPSGRISHVNGGNFMAASSISLNFLPRPLRKALLDFQKEGVKFGIRKQGRCLIGDEMGLGKTLQAISIAYYYKDVWPLLIVAPSSVKFSWIDEIEKWLPEVEPHNLNLIRSGCDISNLGKALIHIVGYGLLSLRTSKLLLEALESHKFNIVILDESHYLKTKCAARTQHLHKLCRKAKHAILLSGTPSLARPRELYFQLDIVCPGKFDSFNKFVRRYCDAREVYYRGKRHFDTSGASNLNELYYLLKTHVMIRRLKKEVLTQLPPKRRQKVTFDISESTSKYKKELQQTMKDFKKCSAIIRGDADDPAIKSPLQEMNRLSTLLYHYTGLVKIGPVLKYIEDLAQGMESKFIVFFRHRLVREAIEEKLVTMKIKYICIAGDVSSGVRGDLVHSFQTDPKVRIAALSIEAASFGLTLTAAHHVVFAELHHTPGVIIQAEDRAHRIGQTLPVNVHYLIARGTVDEILWSMIRRKVYVTSSTLDGKCKELQAEDGDEDQSRQLSACAAWVQDQEEDADDLEDFVMEQLSSKTLKKDPSQRDLRSFFVATPSSSQSNSLECKTGCQRENSTSKKVVEQSLAMNSKEKPISVVDSDEDDFSAWDDLDDNILISEVSDSLENSEQKTPDQPSQPCAENPHNEDNLDAGSKPTRPLDQAIEEEQCPLKPKMLKFKKVKDGKLSFVRSKNYTKLYHKESKCVHVSPLKFVGNDPESESQTLRGYLDDECENEIVKTEHRGDVSEKAVCSDENSKQKDRSFLESLQEADIECVAVVCKTTSSIAQNVCKISDDNACEVIKQETNDEFDDWQHEERQDLKEEAVPNANEVDIFDTPGRAPDSVTPTVLASAQSQCLDESCNQMETDSISEVRNCRQICTQIEKRLTREGCTEDSVLNQSDFVSKGNGDRGSISALNKDDRKSVSHEITFSHVDAKENTDKGKEGHRSNTPENENARNCCNMQSLEENVGSSSVGNISNSCFLQNDTCKENVPNKIAAGVASVCMDNDLSDDLQVASIRNTQVVSPVCTVVEESVGSSSGESSLTSTKSISQNNTCKENVPNKNAAGEASVCMDDDSDDDFQVSSIRNSQMTPPVCDVQKPSKSKKRKAAKKSKNKTATQEVRNGNNGQKAPVEWSCSACTFINDGQLLECSICFTPRLADENNSSISNKDNLVFGISNQQSGDDIAMVEVADISEVRVDSTNINSANENGGQNGVIAKCDVLLKGAEGSGQLATSNGTGQTVEGTAVRNLLIDSKAASRDASQVTKNSTVLEEKASVDKPDNSQVAEPGLPPWSCLACTFLNMSQMIECSICLTPRRRSQRLNTSKKTHLVERQEKDCVNKNNSRKRRRWRRDRAKKDENPRDLEVDIVSSSVTRIDESSGVGDITDCVHDTSDTSVPDREGLTPEQEVPYDTDGRQAHCGLEVHSSEDSSGGIKSRPRKRLKLEEVDAGSTMSDNIGDFSDDSDSLCENRSSTCSSSVSSSTAQKVSTPCVPFDDENLTNSGDCVLLTDDDKMEPSPQQSPESIEIGKNDCEVYYDKLDVSAPSIEAIGSIEEPLAVSSSSIGDNPTGENSLTCLQSDSKVVENLEDLKAAAEEIFMSEWDDDDSWWEEESCSGQSSFPSSNATTSSSPAVTSPGFTKCSDLYSVTELKTKLQATPQQPKTCTTPVVNNIQQFEPAADNPNSNMPLSSVNQVNSTPETAATIEEEETDEEEDVPEAIKLKFCLSLYTERVYLYNEDDRPLGINFCMSDVKNCNMDDLPTVLHHDENLKQVKRMLEAWKRMGEGKKRILRKSALVFDNPLEAYECARKGITRESSYVRHPSKETQIQNVIDTAEEIGGKVRVVKKPKIVSNKRKRTNRSGETNSGQSSSTPSLSGSAASTSTTQESTSSTAPKDRTCYQAVRADGIPLCLFCKGPVDFVDKMKCSDWDARFCSYDCKKEHQVRVSGTAARRALFEAERGICQLCQLDAHTLYQNITALNVRDRPAFLAQTPYSSLPQQMLKKMVMDPKEGMFWEADHITPVSEGGGECGLDNYRTLCVMCHRKATEDLNRRLKQRKGLQYAAGYADISTFFRPLS